VLRQGGSAYQIRSAKMIVMNRLVNAAARLKVRRHGKRGGRDLPSLWLMTDAKRMADPVAAARHLPPGSGLILRHTDPARLRALAEILVPFCRQRRLICLIAGDWRLAARLNADGVHLSERTARVGAAAPMMNWRRQGRRLLTIAAHGFAAMARGARMKPDGILLSPVFATASHPGARALGTVRFAAFTRRMSVPVMALGGVTSQTISRLCHSGAHGIAGIGWIAD